AEVEAAQGVRLADPNRMYPPPPETTIERSHTLSHGKSRISWLRFSSPVLGDTAWAKIIEPNAECPCPTLIVLHGIFAEPGMWPDRGDPFETLVKAGVRVVRSTAPWHGRRMLENRYSGEPVLALGPEGLLTLFQAWIAEIGVLLDWARRNGSRTVAIAGISLGSLTAQILASAASSWPRRLHPDAMLLVATTGVLTDIIYGGSLATGTGLAVEFEKAGWSSAHLQHWSPLLEPFRPPVMGPERVLMVIGKEDDLTPLPGGFLLAERWSIPSDNIFLRPQGHFSLCLGLAADPAPVHRLHDMMRESGPT
ncbi:MAG: alpha/beta hydrolase family protein, partial [Rhodospirillales bacterium]|nr:alpha/beta hydrolase family protein [Rhodospirillales bacterium]